MFHPIDWIYNIINKDITFKLRVVNNIKLFKVLSTIKLIIVKLAIASKYKINKIFIYNLSELNKYYSNLFFYSIIWKDQIKSGKNKLVNLYHIEN